MGSLNSLLDTALGYAARGWPVLPLEPRGKRPHGTLVPHGLRDAITDAKTILGWWASQPDSNIGIVTGGAAGFDVLDVDGEEGAASLAALERAHGPIPSTWEALTGGGGRHLFFVHREGLRNAVRFAPGLDVRADGGYIVAPASVHPSGRPYAWEVAHYPEDGPLAPWPAWLLDLIASGSPRGGAAIPGENAAGAIVEGERNATLASLAGTMRRRRMTEEAIRSALLVENEYRCRPPLEATEVTRIAGSVAGYPPEASVDVVLDASGFAGLKAPVSGERLETILGSLGTVAKEATPLRRTVLREQAVSRLRAAGVGSPVAMVDAALGKQGGAPAEEGGKQGQALELESPVPWPEPVDGAALLDELDATFRKYVVLPPHAPEALALWVPHTYTWEAGADFSPRLSVTGPTKRCGKSRVLEVLAGLVNRPLSTENLTPPALFRAVERYKPTLLVDEGDALLNGAEGLRGLLNAGQRRGGSVLRTVGEDFEPRAFSVFGPVALAAIGNLPDTVRDRSIVIPMRRKARAESVARMRLAEFRQETTTLRKKLARWARDHEAELLRARPALPEALDDRAADGWEPLLAIADAAGDAWPERAREAAIALSAERGEEDGSIGVRLLGDLRNLFETRGADRLPSQEVAEALAAMEERPWAEWGRVRRPITPPAVARLLRPFGIVPRSIRLPGGRTPKGYHRADFEDPWGRYLPEGGAPTRHSATRLENPGVGDESMTAPAPGRGTSEASPESPDSLGCGGVAVTAPVSADGCRVCGSREVWWALCGEYRCRRCHPPGPGAEAG
ncbi:MAG TPA: DUF3631 domain-containing protein [Planctomycetota bacterium]|jgi:hypothetical protein|nr:DUF3631 domain-containing protein [Planctomycetota bacterium]